MDSVLQILQHPIFAVCLCILFGAIAVSGKFSESAANLLLLVLCLVGSTTLARNVGDKRLMAGGVFGLISLCFFLSYWIRPSVQSPNPSTMSSPLNEPNDQPVKASVLAPNLLVRYEMSSLPIELGRQETAYVLQMNPNIQSGELEISNKKRKHKKWPADIQVGQNKPVSDVIYVCEVNNPDTAKTLLDVVLVFDVAFYEVKATKAIYTNNHNGTSSLSLPLPKEPLPPGSMRITYGYAGPHRKTEGYTQGDLYKSFEHSVHIPKIEGGKTVKVYLINQSRYISKLSLPKEATAVPLAGERIGVVLVRPQITSIDQFPMWELMPATYHWKGIPDAH